MRIFFIALLSVGAILGLGLASRPGPGHHHEGLERHLAELCEGRTHRTEPSPSSAP